MSEEAKEPLLRAHLEAHDYPCEGCGYNLRHIREPVCPECGLVIPRPTTDDLNQGLIGTRPAHRLWCIHCHHPVHDFVGEDCPKCGRSLAMQAPPRAEFGRVGRVPTPLMGVMLLALPAMVSVVRFVGAVQKQDSAARGHAVNGLVIALLGMGVMLAWRYASRVGPAYRRAAGLIAMVIAGLCLILSFVLG